jgi:UV DNA damage endonuclease
MFGYACINESLRPLTYKNIRLKTLENKGLQVLKDLVIYNFSHLERVLKWNIEHEIYMYRVPSDIIPFANHPITIDWLWYQDIDVLEIMGQIRALIKHHQMRISMHPDQFTVLNSLRQSVVTQSVSYIVYHARLLKLLAGQDMILHIGGVYGNKKAAINRFESNFKQLPGWVKKYIRIENDDRSYDIYDLLEIGEKLSIPVVIDLHHNRCHGKYDLNDDLLRRVFATWTTKPKVHISSGSINEYSRSHHDFIETNDYKWVSMLLKYNVDIMIEAKMKEKALIKLRKAYETKNIDQ